MYIILLLPGILYSEARSHWTDETDLESACPAQRHMELKPQGAGWTEKPGCTWRISISHVCTQNKAAILKSFLGFCMPENKKKNK